MLFALFLFGVGLLIYHFQIEVGPRLIFTYLFKAKNSHEYFVKIEDQKAINENDVCSICYSEFHTDVEMDSAHEMHDLPDSIMELLSSNKQKIMRTPCCHYFHTSCLVTVMGYQQNCPMCRSYLPPLE